ncbi:monooxygenase family protein [Alkalinema pantanalense CENA528]|uniref:monooxygenase family protein n=1 Tax=Alkalinema pantanalense TaxID=1620705 RepID=UPI003D6E3A2D
MLKYKLYQAALPERPEAVVFVNGMIARDRAGFLWFWRNLNSIYRSTSQAAGCLQVKAGICSPKEVIMVSYWESEEQLMGFFRGAAHREMVQFTQRHPHSLCLYNETYQPEKSGKYSHEPQGMAIVYGVS